MTTASRRCGCSSAAARPSRRRARTRIAWLCCVAAGVAMCGLHAPGLILLGVELIFFLSCDRQTWVPGLILLGGLILSGLPHTLSDPVAKSASRAARDLIPPALQTQALVLAATCTIAIAAYL